MKEVCSVKNCVRRHIYYIVKERVVEGCMAEGKGNVEDYGKD